MKTIRSNLSMSITSCRPATIFMYCTLPRRAQLRQENHYRMQQQYTDSKQHNMQRLYLREDSIITEVLL